VTGASDVVSEALPLLNLSDQDQGELANQLEETAALDLQLKGSAGQTSKPQPPTGPNIDQNILIGGDGLDVSSQSINQTLAETNENLNELLSVELQDIVESTTEIVVNVAESMKEMFSNLLGTNNMVSSRLLGGLLLPAGGSSIADRLLSRLSPGGDHHLRRRNRRLFGRWTLAGSGLVLTLSNGRVQIIEQGTAPTTLNCTRLLALLQRSPDPSKALKEIKQQLHRLQHGTSPVDWSVWTQELLDSLSLPNTLMRWRARASLSRLQRELDRLSEVDAGLMDVLMAAELQSCLCSQVMDGASRTIGKGKPGPTAIDATVS
jgi:hypothetical protein